ncbi:alkaline-phosphatase-like protein [Neohortaea acidophila]|uniref:Alkaline-phosphatase-like protein n=1 Tax=Neohortaea acidophila TaxID=245834 RepID=A0A6A6PII8_9PEZI|nr:alkaline-phosphatase-like protein [Neohortaea acidophila]KAF2479087.1 alkaline-phosphatase-like protein [Neohortaea acidophila]
MDTLDRLRKQLPDTPPVSPPVGFAGQNGFSTPLFPSKPNILYIMADQLAAPQLKIYNKDSQIKTPHLDKLAEQSVVFDSAYCNSPLCAPSRMTMISGQLPAKIGAYDNASPISEQTPTYAHYLRNEGYECVLGGKMHFIGDQLHGYESRLTADIYPGDLGWSVNWDEPETRLEWYHNSSSILQAGPCVRSNQLDYDEEVMYKAKQYLYDYVRKPAGARPFCLTVSLTHPHDPYTIEHKYWDMYEGVDIDMPKVQIPKDQLDPHSKRLQHVVDLEDYDFTDEQIKRAKRAYYGAVSYVDDNIGQLLDTLKRCGLADNTIVIFSGDHGDMLGERGLWYKMSYYESSVRVPMLFSYPKQWKARHVKESVSTCDILPTLVDIVGSSLIPGFPMDGVSIMPHLLGFKGHDNVFAEYMGEGTVAPMMMIRRGPWKYITCPADPDLLYNLEQDPDELVDLTKSDDPEMKKVHEAFVAEATAKWDMKAITEDVVLRQRQRRFCFSALKKGQWTSWDYQVDDDSRNKYIRSHMDLDDLERRARYPIVDTHGNVKVMGAMGKDGILSMPMQAGAFGQ